MVGHQAVCVYLAIELFFEGEEVGEIGLVVFFIVEDGLVVVASLGYVVGCVGENYS